MTSGRWGGHGLNHLEIYMSVYMICILVVVSNMFDFHPEFGEDSHFDYFCSNGSKPPTRYIFLF